jgi:hypothetical protein
MVLGMALVSYSVLIAFPLNVGCRFLLEPCHLNPELAVPALSLIEVAKPPDGPAVIGGWRVMEIGLRLFVVVQVALFGLALRSRIQRA